MPNAVLHKEIRKRKETSPLRYDPKFVGICQSLGHTPKYQSINALFKNHEIDPVTYLDFKLKLSILEQLITIESKLDNFS
jgi:hypothetical protein